MVAYRGAHSIRLVYAPTPIKSSLARPAARLSFKKSSANFASRARKTAEAAQSAHLRLEMTARAAALRSGRRRTGIEHLINDANSMRTTTKVLQYPSGVIDRKLTDDGSKADSAPSHGLIIRVPFVGREVRPRCGIAEHGAKQIAAEFSIEQAAQLAARQGSNRLIAGRENRYGPFDQKAIRKLQGEQGKADQPSRLPTASFLQKLPDLHRRAHMRTWRKVASDR